MLQRRWLDLKRKNRRPGKASIIHHRHQLVLGQNAPDLIILDQHDIEAVLVDTESFANYLFEMIYRLVTLNTKVEEDTTLTGIKWHPEKLL